MAKKRTPGLYKRKGVWHIDKQLFGQRLCESTGTPDLSEAELYLARRVEEIRQQKFFGVRPSYTFDEAAKRYVQVKKHKASIHEDIRELTQLHHYLGGCSLDAIHMNCEPIKQFIADRQKAGVKNRTINYTLQVLRHLLKLAADEWQDEQGHYWLSHAPKIKLLSQQDSRKPRPITWEEQERFFAELSPLLREMALFAVNTGCRAQEICQLRWEWEIPMSELATSIFVLPGWYRNETGQMTRFIKNGEDKLVVLNRIAKAVVDRQRKNNSAFVFAHEFDGKMRPYYSMSTNGWKAARQRAGLTDVRVHDLRHTFGRRLRAAGVSYEDRQDLLGHKSSRITTHYSTAELSNLVQAANLICDAYKTVSPLLLERNTSSRKSPASEIRL